jgi:K+-sensing histidine kinase KdpD
MESLMPKIAKWGGLIVFGVAAFFFAQHLPAISADALASLGVVGALITVAAQHWSGELERKHQLRMAAAERRLEAHQQAFALWRKLIVTVHNENEIHNVVGECQQWWNNNCLYLSPDAREKFRFAYVCAASHKDYLKDRNNPKLITENWVNITDAGEAIVKGVELPTLGENEAKIIEEKKP